MERLVSLLGLFVMIGLAWLMSSDKKRFNVRIVVGGLLLQFALAMFILWSSPGIWFFGQINDFFTHMLEFSAEGSKFLFGIHPNEEEPNLPPKFWLVRAFAFGVLPSIVFVSSFMSVLYYLGVMQPIVRGMAWFMARTLGTSGAESLSTAANVFVGQTEAPLVIRPFIPSLTESELNAVMVGGFAGISGGLMVALVGMGISPGHLLTASFISAPAALLIAKIMVPEKEQPKTLGRVNMVIEKQGANVIEAAAIGASEGMKLAINVAAMLIAFLAFIALADAVIVWIGSVFRQDWSLALLFGYVFYPLAWVMGIESADCLKAGELLGKRMAINEFVAYAELGAIQAAGSEEKLSPRSAAILTYALCGFANFSSIGIQIGGIGGMAPERRGDIARLGLRAMLGGTLACFMTACIAGILL